MSPATSWLKALLDLTPPEPSADADPAEVMEVAQSMLAARAARHDAFERPPVLDEEGRRLLDRLRNRDASWAAALDRARKLVGERLRAASRARY